MIRISSSAALAEVAFMMFFLYQVDLLLISVYSRL